MTGNRRSLGWRRIEIKEREYLIRQQVRAGQRDMVIIEVERLAVSDRVATVFIAEDIRWVDDDRLAW